MTTEALSIPAQHCMKVGLAVNVRNDDVFNTNLKKRKFSDWIHCICNMSIGLYNLSNCLADHIEQNMLISDKCIPHLRMMFCARE